MPESGSSAEGVDLAESLGVGQMPVRAALQRLAAEGALHNVPNVGVTVPKLSRSEFDDVLVNRLLLEGEAAERGARHLSAADCAESKVSETQANMKLMASEFSAAVKLKRVCGGRRSPMKSTSRKYHLMR